jgi:hypothetical protein
MFMKKVMKYRMKIDCLIDLEEVIKNKVYS